MCDDSCIYRHPVGTLTVLTSLTLLWPSCVLESN